MKLISNDIPEHGLLFVTPADQSPKHVTPSLQAKWQSLTERDKGDCVTLLNESCYDVVAYKLVSELDSGNGRRVSERSFGNMDILMGLRHDDQTAGTFDNPAIAAGSFRLFSATTCSPIDTSNPALPHYGIGISTGGGYPSPVKRASNHEHAITVTIDGAVFEDGRFVGPDKTGYFDLVNSIIKAKRNLLEEVSDHVKSGGSLDRLLESAASQHTAAMIMSQSYDFYRQMFIQELLRLRKSCTETEVVNLTFRELGRTWPTLRKI